MSVSTAIPPVKRASALTSLMLGDCRDRLKEINNIDCVVTDPPYGLSFMGKAWDHGVPGTEFWQAALDACKPGAHLLAFGGTRTFHRLACAIEDAGWELRDTIMWVYGSGFPKSLDVSKAIDKAAGAEREVVKRHIQSSTNPDIHAGSSAGQYEGSLVNAWDITAPATDAAKQWDGWGTALKPSFEPILLCRKPLTVVPHRLTILTETTTLLGGLLCQLLSSANNAGQISALSPSECEGASASALMLAAVIHGGESPELFAATDMCSSRETASMCLSIASSWNSILGDVYTSGSTFTTSTVTSLTTALKTLNCLLSASIPGDIIQAVCRPLGSSSSATTAERTSTGDVKNKSDTRTAFARVLASLGQGGSSTTAKSVEASLQPTIRAADSVLSHVRQLLTTENDEKLRPNAEPIIVARKPLIGTVAANVLKHGTGGINVDACRVTNLTGQRPSSILPAWEQDQSLCASCAALAGANAKHSTPETRGSSAGSPAALTSSGKAASIHADINKAATGCSAGLFPAAPATNPTEDSSSSIAESGRTQTGRSQPDTKFTTSTATNSTTDLRTCNACGCLIIAQPTSGSMPASKNGTPNTPVAQGSAAPTGRWPSNFIHDGSDEVVGLFPNVKAGVAIGGKGKASSIYGTPLNRTGGEDMGYGDSGSAARFFYCAKASKADRGDGNTHNTVKPTALMRYLCRLVCPSGGTVLDPFMGSGSTGVAATLEGFNFMGIDINPDYIEIARTRINSV